MLRGVNRNLSRQGGFNFFSILWGPARGDRSTRKRPRKETIDFTEHEGGSEPQQSPPLCTPLHANIIILIFPHNSYILSLQPNCYDLGIPRLVLQSTVRWVCVSRGFVVPNRLSYPYQAASRPSMPNSILNPVLKRPGPACAPEIQALHCSTSSLTYLVTPQGGLTDVNFKVNILNHCK